MISRLRSRRAPRWCGWAASSSARAAPGPGGRAHEEDRIHRSGKHGRSARPGPAARRAVSSRGHLGERSRRCPAQAHQAGAQDCRHAQQLRARGGLANRDPRGQAAGDGGRSRRDPPRGDPEEAVHLDCRRLPAAPPRDGPWRAGARRPGDSEHARPGGTRHFRRGGGLACDAGRLEANAQALQGGGRGGRDHRRGPARRGDRAVGKRAGVRLCVRRGAARGRALGARSPRDGRLPRRHDGGRARGARGPPLPRRDHRCGRDSHAPRARAGRRLSPAMGAVVLRNFTLALAQILHGLLNLYLYIVLIAALLSWVNPDPRNPIVRFLYGVTEPVLYEVRRRLPFVYMGGFDLSPLVVMVAIYLLDRVVVESLFELAYRIATPALPWLRVG